MKLVYIRSGNEEEVYLKGDDQNMLNVVDAVRKLFNLGCRSVSLETKDVSIMFDAEPTGSARAIQGRFKTGYRIIK